jgi:hypothetical protein
MKRMLGGLLVLLLAMPAAADEVKPKEKPKENLKEKAASPAQQYQDLVKEYQKAYQGWVKGFQTAKTQADRQKILAEYQKADGYAPKMLELAKKNPKDPAAVDALVWAATRGMKNGKGTPKAEAFDLLRRDHATSKKIGALVDGLGGRLTPDTEKFLNEVMDKNPDRTIQAKACGALAEGLQNSGRSKEAEKYLKLAAKNYADLGLILVGLKAPVVQGIDQDGKKFKLSDYKGKVVLLDFWGNW